MGFDSGFRIAAPKHWIGIETPVVPYIGCEYSTALVRLLNTIYIAY